MSASESAEAGAGLTDDERRALAECLRLHRAAKATLVEGVVRWICEGCGQPLAPSAPMAAFDDLLVHQTVMLDDLVEGFFARRLPPGSTAPADGA